jgi:hypothetical protein
MKKLNIAFSIALALACASSFAQQTSVQVPRGNNATVVVHGQTSAQATGTQSSTYGMTGASGTINAQNGSTMTFGVETWAQSTGTGSSTSNTAASMVGRLSERPNQASVGVRSSMDSYTSVGSNATVSEVGGNSSATGQIKGPNASVAEFNSAHGYFATGGDFVLGSSSGNLTVSIGKSTVRPRPVTPPIYHTTGQ